MPDPAPSEGQEPGVSLPGSGSMNPVVVANRDQPGVHSSSASGPPPSPASPQPSAIHPQAPPAISDYEMLCRIGGGSYGEVWMARAAVGTCHAVKIVYRKSFDHDRPYEREFGGIKKFEPISRSHPNLVAVLHVGRNDAAGYFYYVMELADDGSESRLQPEIATEGPARRSVAEPDRLKAGLQTYTPRTLRSDLRQRGRLPVEECLQLGLALTDALAHLHRQGLVHRDVKPSNIIFVNGVPKLADIGLVAGVDEAKSFVGTEGYIPPEGPGAPQADLYSLGKVLYEISTGKDRNEFPEPLTNLGDLAEQTRLLELNAVIHKACRTDTKERYATAEAMHADLLRLRLGQSLRRQRGVERAVRCARLAVPVAVLVVAAVLLLPKILRQAAPQGTQLAPDKASVFVLPFRSVGTNEVSTDLCSRITDAFIDSLALIDGVRRSPRKSGWRHQDEDEVRHALAKTNDMRHVLTGRMASANDTLTLALRLYERRSDQPLWTEMFTGKTNEVVALERRALEQLAARLRLRISAAEQRQIDTLFTNNLEALGWYRQAQAVSILRGGTLIDYIEAKELAGKSLTLDPRYLDADFYNAYMLRLISQVRHPAEILPTVERQVDAILRQDDTHLGALDHRAGIALVIHGNWEDFDRFYERKLQSISGQEWHMHRAWGLRLQGRFEEARVEQQKAEHPEPTDPDGLYLMCSSRWLDRRYDEAIRVARRILELYPGHIYGSYWLAHCLVAKGDYKAGTNAIAQAQAIWTRQELTALLGYAYAGMGQPDKAREVLKQLLELRNTDQYLQPYFIARVYAALGDKKEALDWLEQAVAERSEYLFNPDWGGLRTDLAWNDLQGEPRYWQLCERAGLDKDQWPRPRPTP